jgi:hypothetical protein
MPPDRARASDQGGRAVPPALPCRQPGASDLSAFSLVPWGSREPTQQARPFRLVRARQGRPSALALTDVLVLRVTLTGRGAVKLAAASDTFGPGTGLLRARILGWSRRGWGSGA